MANIYIKTKAKYVENETTKKQAEDLKNTQAKIAEQNKKVISNREKAKLEAEVKKQAEIKNNEIDTKQVVELASKVLATKKSGGFFKGLLIGIVVGLLIGFVGARMLMGSLTDKVDSIKENADQIIDENFLGYTAADFKNAILGDAIQKKDLLVMEQPLTIETTITKAGLANLEIFSKVKDVSFAGKGLYTVDLSKMNDSQIEVDEENKEVTIHIPHVVLNEVVADFNNTTFEDTEKGLLAFGDLSLTMEDQNELEKSVQDSMRQELNTKELLDKADEIAKTKTWEIFNPLVEAISDEYITNIVIN